MKSNRRQFVSLGSGSSTATRFRDGYLPRREFKPLAGGTSATPCEKINFKVFDFANGSLVWQKRADNPLLATDGTVYARTYTEVLGFRTNNALTTDTTVSLPDRSTSYTTLGYEVGVIQWELETDTALSTLAHFENVSAIPDALNVDMSVSEYRVNDAGDMAFNQVGVPFLNMLITDPGTTDTSITYRINMIPAKSTTNFILRMNSTGTTATYTDATFAADDDAATIQSTIETAFSTNVTTVTVTGDTLSTSAIKIVIDWASNLHYLDEFSIDYPSGTYTTNLVGNAWLRNLQSGIRGTYGSTGGFSSSFNGPSCWKADGSLLRQQGATGTTLRSYDTSTSPWVQDWEKTPLSGKTPIVPDESALVNIDMVSANGVCGFSFQFTSGLTDVLVNRMSVITYNDDGSGETDYSNSGANFTGYYPYSLAIEDGGTDAACDNLDWPDAEVQVAHGDSFTNDNYAKVDGDSIVRFSTGAGYAKSHGLNVGGGSVTLTNYPGFNDTHSGYARHQRIVELSEFELANNQASGTVGYWVTTEASGIDDPDTLIEINRNRIHYTIGTQFDLRVNSDTEWRIRFRAAGFDDEVTSWLTHSTTLATLNSELLTLFDSDANSEQVVIATVNSDSSPISVPIYQRGIYLEALSARSNDNADDMEIPRFWNTTSSVATIARGLAPDVYLDVRTYSRFQQKTLGAVKFSDGTFTWARNFNPAGSAKQIYAAVLHDSKFYVYSQLQCAEVFTGLLAEIEETSTSPYASTGATVTIDVTFTNYTGSVLTSFALTTAEDGNGSISTSTVPTTLNIGASTTITLTYTTSAESIDPTVTAYATGTKSDATTATSNTVSNLLDITGKIPPPPP